jgi:hypothetical protein
VGSSEKKGLLMATGSWSLPRGMGARWFAPLAACALAVPALGQVYSSGDINVAIPDPGSVTNTIHVAGGPASISSLHVVILVRHQWDADLRIALVHGSTYLRLTSDLGSSSDNYYLTRFTDAAATSISAGAPPFVGSFRPLGGVMPTDPNATISLPATSLPNLAAFNGQNASGDWTLWVDDHTAGIAGALRYWSLEFNGAVDPNGDPNPPSSYIDLGTLSSTNEGQMAHAVPVAVGQVQFFKLVVPTNVTAPLYLDLDTVGSVFPQTQPGIVNDTYMYLFDNNGVPLVRNDDDGPGYTSLLSFGAGSGQVIGDSTDLSGGVANGFSGSLPAGTYWLAVSGYRLDVDTGWVVGSTCTVSGTIDIRMRTNITLGPVCGTSDYNNDGDFATDADIEDFFRCLAGDCCPTCFSSDFNGDGDYATDADIEAFFRVLAGQPC